MKYKHKAPKQYSNDAIIAKPAKKSVKKATKKTTKKKSSKE